MFVFRDDRPHVMASREAADVEPCGMCSASRLPISSLLSLFFPMSCETIEFSRYVSIPFIFSFLFFPFLSLSPSHSLVHSLTHSLTLPLLFLSFSPSSLFPRLFLFSHFLPFPSEIAQHTLLFDTAFYEISFRFLQRERTRENGVTRTLGRTNEHALGLRATTFSDLFLCFILLPFSSPLYFTVHFSFCSYGNLNSRIDRQKRCVCVCVYKDR